MKTMFLCSEKIEVGKHQGICGKKEKETKKLLFSEGPKKKKKTKQRVAVLRKEPERSSGFLCLWSLLCLFLCRVLSFLPS